jgi:hypothetical protein
MHLHQTVIFVLVSLIVSLDAIAPTVAAAFPGHHSKVKHVRGANRHEPPAGHHVNNAAAFGKNRAVHKGPPTATTPIAAAAAMPKSSDLPEGQKHETAAPLATPTIVAELHEKISQQEVTLRQALADLEQAKLDAEEAQRDAETQRHNADVARAESGKNAAEYVAAG